MKKPEKKLSLFGTIFGMVLAPRDTANSAFSSNPRHVVTLLATFYLMIIIPVIVHSQYNTRSAAVPLYNEKALAIIFSFVTITLISFIISEFILLILMGYRLQIGRITAAVVYSIITPLLFFIMGMYVISYIADRDLTYLTFVLSSNASHSKLLVGSAEFLLVFACLSMCVSFFFCIKAALDIPRQMALVLFCLSLIPFVFACLIGGAVSCVVVPGGDTIIRQFLINPSFILIYA